MPLGAAQIVAAVRRGLRRLSVATTPEIRRVRRQYTKALAEAPPIIIVAVSDALLNSGNWPERVMGSELLCERRDAIRLVNVAAIERWANGLADWGSVDLYGVTVAASRGERESCRMGT